MLRTLTTFSNATYPDNALSSCPCHQTVVLDGFEFSRYLSCEYGSVWCKQFYRLWYELITRKTNCLKTKKTHIAIWRLIEVEFVRVGNWHLPNSPCGPLMSFHCDVTIPKLFDGPFDCDVIMKNLRTDAMSSLWRLGNCNCLADFFHFVVTTVGQLWRHNGITSTNLCCKPYAIMSISDNTRNK